MLAQAICFSVFVLSENGFWWEVESRVVFEQAMALTGAKRVATDVLYFNACSCGNLAVTIAVAITSLIIIIIIISHQFVHGQADHAFVHIHGT